jgi:hypothetical protein
MGKIFSFFVKRRSDADEISDFSARRMGVSMAATWSWGAAIAIGIAIMHNMGLLAFTTWTIGNILSIPVFGLLYTKFKFVRNWKNLPPFLFLWIFIGIFAVVLNLSALKAALGGGSDITAHVLVSEPFLTPLIMFIGLFIVWYIHKTGLRGSVLTDVGQFTLQFVGVIGLITMALITGARAEIFWINEAGEAWIFTAFLGIITGATASGMQWQRIAKTPKGLKLKATLWGGALFGIFMGFVTIAGFLFDGSLAVTIPFFIGVLAVATSTTDSGISTLQFANQKLFKFLSIGTIIGIIAVFCFPLFGGWGLTAIWGFYAGVRWKIILVLLLVTGVYWAFSNWVSDETRLRAVNFLRRGKFWIDFDEDRTGLD